ncbi:kinase-like protein [Artomyces pyxidatus]|uniref:Kinase-like protein n=1 Tax=Artomyces pyxidatus TaxID=48021 RepID=A0ACB8TGU5_9AGAM|nr:kinase-like protein [Artomyces pyxidatus]
MHTNAINLNTTPVTLPSSLKEWKAAHPAMDPHWSQPWEALRTFFQHYGYTLYIPGQNGHPGQANWSPRPASSEIFGCYGNIAANYISYFGGDSVVFGARDRGNRDVVIKVISKGEEGIEELRILQYLNSAPLRSHPKNNTITVLDFLYYLDWSFIVMPAMTTSSDVPMYSANEALDFCEQLLSTLSFLHDYRIAHLDIASENILINYHGELPERYAHGRRISPPHPFRATFPARYVCIDFGISAMFPVSMPLSQCLTAPTLSTREHRAPEGSIGRLYNPFAADVYQSARLMYGWFMSIVPAIPGFLDLLQDMSRDSPAQRISAADAFRRMRAIRASAPTQELWKPTLLDLQDIPPVPSRNAGEMLDETLKKDL